MLFAMYMFWFMNTVWNIVLGTEIAVFQYDSPVVRSTSFTCSFVEPNWRSRL